MFRSDLLTFDRPVRSMFTGCQRSIHPSNILEKGRIFCHQFLAHSSPLRSLAREDEDRFECSTSPSGRRYFEIPTAVSHAVRAIRQMLSPSAERVRKIFHFIWMYLHVLSMVVDSTTQRVWMVRGKQQKRMTWSGLFDGSWKTAKIKLI